ncbi:MAG: ribonuclease R [Paludibacter sp.]|nr:ribonuclease R [Bacteroidales bacterium]MCM1069341.1 ribonuclease R [Prevotella sp.]MCM1353861.1 ribonuclease R [Bacteroides sp.]MCM1442889.1 ribonuclease R [Muribaculum sp.]MCM1481934.1 ribonuclease R [Paludibacter sp.]
MKTKDMRGKRPRLNELVESIQQQFSNHPDKTYTIKQLTATLKLRDIRDRLAVKNIVDNLINYDFITENDNGKYQLKKSTTTHQQTQQDTFVGKLELSNRGGYVVVRHKLLHNDIFVPTSKLNGAKNGQKVVVKLTRWKRNMTKPEGEITDVLGDCGNNNTEMHAILAEYGLPYSYPAAMEAEAAKISADITQKDCAKRRDMRNVNTFTIDPVDAKDFDDAISIQTTDDNQFYEIGVHIADVSHYVKPGSLIDKEAYNRATSVYLVDRTIPMLPEKLCNEICSLRPDEDKLAFSVIFIMDNDANIINYKICHTIIRSNRRFTYEEAQQRIETQQGDYAQELLTLNRLAQIMRQRRFQQGAIAFEREEVRFRIDDQGKPIDVYIKQIKEANQLVEEFMLLANRTVAQHIANPKNNKRKNPQPKTFVYRVHDLPDNERIKDFAQFIRRFGYNLKTSAKQQNNSKNINKLLAQAKGTPEQNLIETLAVRSMAKAVYSTDNIGHYGLAFPYYTHFTSPIRRYPDLIVHRLLDRYAKGAPAVPQDEYEDKCRHCSGKEQLAANAERASNKYKQVEYMTTRIGQTYQGIISGVTEWGIYVELNENKCEGMIPLRQLDPNDYFIYDEKQYCVEAVHSGKKYQLGDKISVKVTKADLQKRQLDFSVANQNNIG